MPHLGSTAPFALRKSSAPARERGSTPRPEVDSRSHGMTSVGPAGAAF